MAELPSTMKAVRLAAHGGLDVLQHGPHPLPVPSAGDLLVRVLATTVSGWDLKYRRGELPHGLPGRRGFPLPMQPGRDAAGIVEAVGSGVRGFEPGDRVVGLVHPADPLSELSLRGLSNLSTGIDYPGHTMFGGNAQFVARPASYWLPLPANVGFNEAAAAMWGYATSHRILTERLQARVGDRVLVIGASGGMGTATLDLARLMGLHVTATTRDATKAPALRERGADAVLVLGRGGSDDAARARALAPGLGFDAAIDYSGDERMLRLAVATLRPGGTLVITGGEGTPGPLPFTATDFIRLELNLRGTRASTLNDQRSVVALLAQGRIRPAIHAVMPLAQVREAQALLEAGGVVGRIVLDPWA